MSENRIITAGEAITTDWPPREHILGPLQPGDVGMIAGPDGSGKSWQMLAAAFTVAYGRSACGIFREGNSAAMFGPALIYAGEDRRNDHGLRMSAVIREIRQDGINVMPDDDQVKVAVLEGKRMPLVQRTGGGATGQTTYAVTSAGKQWANGIAPYRMVGLDPLRMFHDLEESEGPGMDFLVRWLVSVAMKNQQIILLAHHSSQGAILNQRNDHHAGRGATDLPAGCRGVWTLRGPTDKEVDGGQCAADDKVLVNSKASHRAADKTVYLRHTAEGVLRRIRTDAGSLAVGANQYDDLSNGDGEWRRGPIF